MQFRTPAATAVLAAVAAAIVGGCSSTQMPTIGSITGSKSVSDTDRVFLMAIGSWDRNHDNIVTCDEWKGYAAELFNAADTNRDGSLDATEWQRLVSTDRMFQTADLRYFDANGDGKVSKAELVDKPNPAFALMDTAHTCSLNGAQIAGARSKTEYDVSGAPRPNGDPREAGGEVGKVANGGTGQ